MRIKTIVSKYSRRARLGGVAFALLAASTIPATANPTAVSCVATRHDARLTSTVSPAGENPVGTAGVSEDAGCSQLFGVTVVANLPDGEEIVIVASAKAGPVIVESVTMFGGIGQLVMVQSASAAGAPWVGDVKVVEVYRYIVPRGTRARMPILLLRGKF